MAGFFTMTNVLLVMIVDAGTDTPEWNSRYQVPGACCVSGTCQVLPLWSKGFLSILRSFTSQSLCLTAIDFRHSSLITTTCSFNYLQASEILLLLALRLHFVTKGFRSLDSLSNVSSFLLQKGIVLYIQLLERACAWFQNDLMVWQ